MKKTHILIVEDDAIIASVLSETLASAGYSIKTADNGKDGIRLTLELNPDLVLMDIRIKGDMDGIETAGYIREHSDIPLIYLTAHSDDAVIERAKQTRPSGYLIKPVRERELIAAIEMAVNKHLLDKQNRQMDARIQYIQKMKSLGTMAGAVAHHFNNMLMVIAGYAEMILDSTEQKYCTDSVQEILITCKKAKQLTDQLITYTGHTKERQEVLNMADLIKETMHILEISLPQGSFIHYNLPDNIDSIYADKRNIKEIIINLVTNAAEAVQKETGIITISAGVRDADSTFLSESCMGTQLPQGRYVFLEVADNGCGMDEETKGRIFDPFFTTKFFGRGLGLSAVMGIVKNYCGGICVISKPGQGTTVSVMLPVMLPKIID